MTLGYPTSGLKGQRSRLGLGLTAIRRGFELYECLLVLFSSERVQTKLATLVFGSHVKQILIDWLIDWLINYLVIVVRVYCVCSRNAGGSTPRQSWVKCHCESTSSASQSPTWATTSAVSMPTSLAYRQSWRRRCLLAVRLRTGLIALRWSSIDLLKNLDRSATVFTVVSPGAYL